MRPCSECTRVYPGTRGTPVLATIRPLTHHIAITLVILSVLGGFDPTYTGHFINYITVQRTKFEMKICWHLWSIPGRGVAATPPSSHLSGHFSLTLTQPWGLPAPARHSHRDAFARCFDCFDCSFASFKECPVFHLATERSWIGSPWGWARDAGGAALAAAQRVSLLLNCWTDRPCLSATGWTWSRPQHSSCQSATKVV